MYFSYISCHRKRHNAGTAAGREDKDVELRLVTCGITAKKLGYLHN